MIYHSYPMPRLPLIDEVCRRCKSKVSLSELDSYGRLSGTCRSCGAFCYWLGTTLVESDLRSQEISEHEDDDFDGPLEDPDEARLPVESFEYLTGSRFAIWKWAQSLLGGVPGLAIFVVVEFLLEYFAAERGLIQILRFGAFVISLVFWYQNTRYKRQIENQLRAEFGWKPK